MNAALDQRVCGDDDPVNFVPAYKRIDDFRNVAAQGWLATREPEIGNLRHRPRDLVELFEGQVARLIQLLVVEARFAERIAA